MSRRVGFGCAASESRVCEEIVADQLWARLEPLIPARTRRFRFPGRLRTDDRAALEVIVGVARTGSAGTACRPACSAHPGATCWRRLTEWHEAGVWQRLHETLLAEPRAAGLLDLERALV